MTNDLHYFSIDADGRATVNQGQCTLEDDDAKRALICAERWAAICKQEGVTPPAEPLVAVVRLAHALLTERCAAEELWMAQQTQDRRPMDVH